MACDADSLLQDIACLECAIPPGLVGYAYLAQLNRLTGATLEQILAAIPCLQCDVPPGMVGYTLLAQTCNVTPVTPEPPVGDFRITEASDIRETEDGGLRIVE